MNVLLDHLAATILVATVVLMLVASQHHTRRTALEASVFYHYKQQQLSFVETLRKDLQAAARLGVVSERAADSTFVYWAQTDPDDPVQHEIAYRRTRTGERDGRPVYQVVRLVDGHRTGASPALLTEWAVEARNEEGGAILRPADGRQIVVRFTMAPGPASASFMPPTRWEATFHPPLLRQARAL